MSSETQLFLAEREACKERLRTIPHWTAPKEEVDAAITKIGAGGLAAADSWLWFVRMMAKMPEKEKRQAETLLAGLHQASARWLVSAQANDVPSSRWRVAKAPGPLGET